MVTIETKREVVLGGKTYRVVEDFDQKHDIERVVGEKSSFTATTAESMKNVLIGVLPSGYVGLIDFMGSDDRIVQAARVSYGKGTVKLREDRSLIRYLMRHKHTTPFEMVELAFIAKMPITVARQWIRHRTANVNEYSLRYSEATDEIYIPDTDRILGQGKRNRQGSEGSVDPEVKKKFRNDLMNGAKRAYMAYQRAISGGIARETARQGLPVGTYTKWHWKIDLHNLFHFLELRLDPHAQWEIRQYAVPMFELARLVAPNACEAFDDFVVQSATFSRKEQDALSLIMNGIAFEKACELSGIELIRDGRPMTTGEGVEFMSKLDSIKSRAERLLRTAA